MAEKLYFYPKWLRFWHTLNAVFCLLLIVSGISMQYSSIDTPLIAFDTAVSIHNFSGVALTVSYLLFLLAT